MSSAINNMTQLVKALEIGLDGGCALPLKYGSALKIEPLSVTLRVKTYSWQVGSNCSVRGKHTVIVAERRRQRSGMWYKVRFDDGKTKWVYWTRIGFWLHGKQNS